MKLKNTGSTTQSLVIIYDGHRVVARSLNAAIAAINGFKSAFSEKKLECNDYVRQVLANAFRGEAFPSKLYTTNSGKYRLLLYPCTEI